jgi:hypothetical protein
VKARGGLQRGGGLVRIEGRGVHFVLRCSDSGGRCLSLAARLAPRPAFLPLLDRDAVFAARPTQLTKYIHTHRHARAVTAVCRSCIVVWEEYPNCHGFTRS